jgi:glutaconate CoA-transferase subunit A
LAFNKQTSLKEAVATLRDGMTIGIGGWGPRRKPMALIREIVRSGIKNLSLVAFGGADVGMLCAAGSVKKITYGFISLDFIPLEPYFRKARQSGAVEAVEVDEGNVVLGLRAAGWRMPFLPTRAGLATDVMKNNPQFKTITSPYADGEVLLAMPALKLDAALIHVNRADKLGNTQTDGPDHYFDDLFARAADSVIVSCEEIYDRLDLTHSDQAKSNLFERYLVSKVVHAPCGAHPSSCPQVYGWDVGHFKTYTGSAGEENGWANYRASFIDKGEEEYVKAVGGADKIKSLPLPVM